MNIPDGQKIKIKNKTLASCGELLFKAYMIGIEASQGIHRMIYDSIMSCDKDIQCALFKNIWLSGGTTMIKGVDKRLIKEINVLLAQNKQNVNCVVIPNEKAIGQRKYGAWVGMSLLNLLYQNNFDFIIKDDYDECGSSIVQRKCF